MKRVLGISLSVAFAVAALGAPATAGPPSCHWGQETKAAIQNDGGRAQGDHASDPSGDGLGRDGVEDRVGLANVIEPGNLVATCEFVTT